MKQFIHDCLVWLRYTSLLIGYPCTIIFLCWAMVFLISSGTCTLAEINCSYGVSIDNILAEYFKNIINSRSE